MVAEKVAGALVVLFDGYLVERSVTVDDWTVFAAQRYDVAGGRGLGGRFPVDSGAVRGFGNEVS